MRIMNTGTVRKLVDEYCIDLFANETERCSWYLCGTPRRPYDLHGTYLLELSAYNN